jgi:hypothetical protein
MGNEKCSNSPGDETTKTRKLKKIVDVGQIGSRLIDMPGGQKFDFQFVINQQIYPVLQKSEGFWFRYKPPFNENPSQLTSHVEFKDMNLSEMDVALLEKTFGKIAADPIKSDEISCLANLPQYQLWGTVNSFELMSKIGLGIGFTRTGSLPVTGIPSLNFGVETYQLDMNMVATHPLTMTQYAGTNVTAKQTRTQVDFSLPLSNLLLDPSFYFQTPLARVSYNALEKAVKDIQEQLDSKEWYTRVLMADEHVATILAGSNHNVQKGDIFDIYNEKTIWGSDNGEIPVPCESKYLGSIESEQPIATVEIVSVSDDISNGKVVFESGMPMRMGAKVKIRKLLEPVVTKAVR